MKVKGKQSIPITIKDDIIIINVKSKKYGMKEIIIDKDDYEIVSKFTWGVRLDKVTNKFYSQAHDYDDKSIKLHRYITNCPDGMVVDHINGNPLDNRRCNIRICTRAENNRNANKRKDGLTSKYKGVKKHPKDNKYHAWINYNKKRIYLGGFKTEIEAAKAYNEGAIKYHGDYACLNIITEKSTSENDKIKVKVLRHERVYYSIHSHGGGSILLYLECGHVKRQKGNVKIPKFCFCKECFMNRKSEVLK